MTPEESWEQRKYEVGRAMHEGWKRQKVLNGWADHPWPGCWTEGVKHHEVCYVPLALHHADMIPWEQLPASHQEINYEGGKEGYILGFEAGVVWAEKDFGEGYEQGYVRGHLDGYSDGFDEGYDVDEDEREEECCARC